MHLICKTLKENHGGLIHEIDSLPHVMPDNEPVYRRIVAALQGCYTVAAFDTWQRDDFVKAHVERLNQFTDEKFPHLEYRIINYDRV